MNLGGFDSALDGQAGCPARLEHACERQFHAHHLCRNSSLLRFLISAYF